ncbi:hypothetical protein PC119_g6224 [Phytophthora cactorum]|nr:hypothetical protein PC119_g6224 [Phytophthora cactorum]
MNYEKLTQIFQVSKSHIFHASTLYKWHSLCAAGLQDFIVIQALQELSVLVSRSDLWLPAALSQWTFDALEGKLFSAAHLAGRLAPLRASAKRSGGAHNLTRTTEYSISRLNATQKWNTCMVGSTSPSMLSLDFLNVVEDSITSSGPDARVGRLRSVLTTASGLNSYLKD